MLGSLKVAKRFGLKIPKLRGDNNDDDHDSMKAQKSAMYQSNAEN